jgi:NTE family protein
MKTPKIGIALSGGGIKGAAHIGALKLMSEIGVYPNVFSGTSAGALVGAFAAADYPPEEILAFFKSTNIFSPSNFAWGKPAFINTHKFEDSLKSYFPEDSFESLKHPLYVSATDITHGLTKVFHKGPLIKILMASSAYPVLFSPIEMDKILYADGAILNNFPVEPLQGKCDKIIGINVHKRRVIKNEELTSSYKMFRRAYEISTHYLNFKKYKDCDVVIELEDLNRFSTLRTNHAEDIYKIGYETAANHKEDLLALLKSEVSK